jgi:hypothetical protein
MPTNHQNLKVDGDPNPLWRVWRVDDTRPGRKISMTMTDTSKRAAARQRRLADFPGEGTRR